MPFGADVGDFVVDGTEPAIRRRVEIWNYTWRLEVSNGRGSELIYREISAPYLTGLTNMRSMSCMKVILGYSQYKFPNSAQIFSSHENRIIFPYLAMTRLTQNRSHFSLARGQPEESWPRDSNPI